MKTKDMEKMQCLYDVLKRISRYQQPQQVKRDAEQIGLGESEAVEMAYENVLTEAKFAIKGLRRPK